MGYWSYLDKAMDYVDNVPFVGTAFRGAGSLYKMHNRSYYVLDKNYSKAKNVYNDTSVEAYEWRAKHSNDPLVGKFWSKANARDLYNERVVMQNDRKRNLGYDWKDNAYPRTAFGSAFGGSVGFANSSPLFDVNKAILDLYGGVSKW